MNLPSSELGKHLLEKFNLEIKNPELLIQALTHKSYANEVRDNRSAESGPSTELLFNERLEFLGDSVLSLVLSEKLYRQFPLHEEGVLSRMRSSLVNEEALAKKAIGLQLGSYLRLGKGEQKTQGQDKPRLLASTLEAILGAIFIEQGYGAAQLFVLQIFSEDLQRIDQFLQEDDDYKTKFQELIQKYLKLTPEYYVIEETLNSESKFKVEVRVLGHVLGSGSGSNRKFAEKAAAKSAWLQFQGKKEFIKALKLKSPEEL